MRLPVSGYPFPATKDGALPVLGAIGSPHHRTGHLLRVNSTDFSTTETAGRMVPVLQCARSLPRYNVRTLTIAGRCLPLVILGYSSGARRRDRASRLRQQTHCRGFGDTRSDRPSLNPNAPLG